MLGIGLLTRLKGKFVGQDLCGNKYYSLKRLSDVKEKRWIIYKGIAEASKIPPEWHAWLHHTRELPPLNDALPKGEWEKKRLPNLTGTPYAYFPHLERKKRREAPGTYEAWIPPKDKK